MELMQASMQWANRPADERFETVLDLETNAVDDSRNSQEGTTSIRNLKFEAYNNGLVLQGKKAQAVLTNFAMNQLLTRIGYPASALINPDGGERIPSNLAAQVLNHRIALQNEEDMVQLYVRKPSNEFDVPLVKAITSDKYARVPDSTLMNSVRDLTSNGWMVPPARPSGPNMPGTRKATAEDILRLESLNGGGNGLEIKVGDEISPAGLYRGDRDMFVFLVNPDSGVDDGNGNALMRTLFIQNSEVGYRSFKVTEAICQTVCGNHIVWGARDIIVQKYRHIGDAYDKIMDVMNNLVDRLGTNQDLSRELQVMKWMRLHEIGTDRLGTVDAIYKGTNKLLSRKTLGFGYDTAAKCREVDGDPNSWMGLVNGLTRYSQTLKNADERMALDESVGSLFNLACEAMT